MPGAHSENLTLHLVAYYPAHAPRAADPHYRLFGEARRRLKRLGKLRCWIDNHECAGEIELHHALIEFALANGVDVTRFEQRYPEFGVSDDESFARWIESEGNLLPLCERHHRGDRGVHLLPYPLWVAQRVWRDELPAPGEETRIGASTD